MNAPEIGRRLALLAGGAAIVAMGGLTACGTSTKEEPTTAPTTTPTQSSVSLAPSEKSAGGPNSFSPTINPGPPNSTCTRVVGNDCVR